MNGTTVTIGDRDYLMRWEIGPARELEESGKLSSRGVRVAWETSAFSDSDLAHLWHMALRCRGGLPKMTYAEAEELLQTYIDEHSLSEARDVVGEAGIAGKFLTLATEDPAKDAEPKDDAAPLGAGTPKP
jgi:hypothetical protein